MSEKLRVKITSCNNPSRWYAKRIGEEVVVSKRPDGNYSTIWGAISDKDCEVVLTPEQMPFAAPTPEKPVRNEIKMPDPMAPFFSFMTGMDWMRPGAYFMNFHVEGSFVTFYMPIDAKLHYESLLAQKGYRCEQTMLWAMERGYPGTDFYFRVGPYQMRLSVQSEFRDRQKRLLESGRI